MTTNSSFHPPVILADARERRARKQRPYPEVCEYTPPTPDEIAEADERHAIARGNRWALVLVLLTIAPLLVALGLHLYFR
jgi:predicted anti-sigma-YlaC factor YlaD